MTPQEALQRAIEIIGGITPTARAIGVSRQAVEQWDICPERHVDALITAMEAARRVAPPDRFDLRPDLFKRPRKR